MTDEDVISPIKQNKIRPNSFPYPWSSNCHNKQTNKPTKQKKEIKIPFLKICKYTLKLFFNDGQKLLYSYFLHKIGCFPCLIFHGNPFLSCFLGEVSLTAAGQFTVLFGV